MKTDFYFLRKRKLKLYIAIPHTPDKYIAMSSLDEFAKDPEKFEEMKSFFLDWMGSEMPYIINPEEGLAALEGSPFNLSYPLYQEYLKEQNAFFAKYWHEELMPNMTPEAFLLFLDQNTGMDVPSDFKAKLLAYCESL